MGPKVWWDLKSGGTQGIVPGGGFDYSLTSTSINPKYSQITSFNGNRLSPRSYDGYNTSS